MAVTSETLSSPDKDESDHKREGKRKRIKVVVQVSGGLAQKTLKKEKLGKVRQDYLSKDARTLFLRKEN